MSRPQRSLRITPPTLDDDSMAEIFVRLPPDEPASLVRAAAVDKRLRGIISDATFGRFYRNFHGAPPMLGFLHNDICDDTHCVSRFVPTVPSFRPPGCLDCRDWFVLDSRHGLVLFSTLRTVEEFVVCDPMANLVWKVPTNPTRHSALLYNEGEDEDFSLTWNAAVLCSKNGCDHLGCRGGPFLVVFVGSDEADGNTFAAVYSSETGTWRETVYVDEPNAISEIGRHSVLLGNKVYFPCEESSIFMEYNVDQHELSVIETPYQGSQDHLMLMAAEDDMLLFVGVWGCKLHLRSMEVGAEAWARCRVIDLKPLLPRRTVLNVSVIGAVEGAGVIFLNTTAGLFTIDLNSGQTKKVHKKVLSDKIIPYMSFYTGVLQGH